MLQCDVTFHLIILGFNSNSDSSLWLWVAQAGQPEAKCLSEFPHGHQHIPNWISQSQAVSIRKSWVRLDTSSVIVCILARLFLCHFLADGIFRSATQVGKGIFRLSILVTQIVPQTQLIWTMKSLQQPGVWVSGLQREVSICCHDHAFWGLKFVLLDKRDPLFLSLVLMVYSPQELRQNEGTPFLSPSPDQRHGSPSRATGSHPPGLAKEGSQHTAAHDDPC